MSDADEKGKKVEQYVRWSYSATLIYFIVILFIASLNYYFGPNSRVNLNELGDFFAGAMSPLAIYWLVMVYMQQRKEMRGQVEQTELIAKETREQVEVMKKEFTIKHDPLFVCDSLTKALGHGKNYAEIKLMNFGGVALHVHAKGTHNCSDVEIGPSRHVKVDEHVKLKIPYNGNLGEANDAFLEFEYLNRFGTKSRYRCFFGKGATKEDFFSDKLPSQE
jgi:hypothetical protein